MAVTDWNLNPVLNEDLHDINLRDGAPEGHGWNDATRTLMADIKEFSNKAMAGELDGLLSTEEQKQKILEKSIAIQFDLMRTGRVYKTRFFKFSSGTTSTGTKLLDNAGLTCVPSTDTVEGTDDYDSIPMFKWWNVNYTRDDDGTPRPIAIEGMEEYATSGSVDVGVMQMSFYWNVVETTDDEENAVQDWIVSDLPHEELGLKPWPECVKADGTVMPWCIGSKYFSGTASDGLPRSQPGLSPEYNYSYNAIISKYQAKGAGYWGAGLERSTFYTLFTAIKYATKNSQSIMQGCTGWNVQPTVAAAESGVKRVLLSASNANNFPVGCTVSVGSGGDRGGSGCHSIANRVKVLSKETVGDYVALNLDVANSFTTTASSVVTSMPLIAGDTDTVIGHHDGSYLSYADAHHTARCQGREYLPGLYQTVSNVVWYVDATAKTQKVYYAPKSVVRTTNESAIPTTYTLLATAANTATDGYIADIEVDATTGVWWPTRNTGAGTTTGWADYNWIGSSTGYREWLLAGRLNNGSVAGSVCLHGNGGLSGAGWYIGGAD